MKGLRSADHLERFIRRWAMVSLHLDAKAVGPVRARLVLTRRMVWGDALLAAGDFDTFLQYCWKPARLWALHMLAPSMSDEDYWRLLAAVYQQCGDSTWWYRPLRQLLSAPRPGREHFMSAEGRAALAALPDPLPVHRGAQLFNLSGWSWTPIVGVARHFAFETRTGGQAMNRSEGFVVHGQVAHADVVGFLEDFDIAEVVCDPERVTVESIDVERFPGPRLDAMTDDELAAYARERGLHVAVVERRPDSWWHRSAAETDESIRRAACSRELRNRAADQRTAAEQGPAPMALSVA